MWIVREFSRLLFQIAVAVAICTAVAGIKALVSSGSMFRTWKVVLVVLGCLLLLLAGFGNRNTASSRRLNQRFDHASTFLLHIRGVPAPTEGPTLTPGAVFLGSAIVLLALGIFA